LLESKKRAAGGGRDRAAGSGQLMTAAERSTGFILDTHEEQAIKRYEIMGRGRPM
jgi:hypothetical protein